MFTILLIILILALIGGGLGHSRYGYAGWSPAGILVVILLFMLFTGHRVQEKQLLWFRRVRV